jgi:hypothetical protein
MFWPLAASAFWGVVWMRRRSIPLLPLVAPVVIATLIAAAFYGLTRFRVPAEISLVVLGGVGANALWERVRALRRAGGVDTAVRPAVS